jgi:hypothetical protein
MKSLRIAFIHIFYMQCIREIRIYILFLLGGLNIKRNFLHGKSVTSKSCLFLAPICLAPPVIYIGVVQLCIFTLGQ